MCSINYLPKPGIRYRLSRTVNDISKRVNVLLQNAKHDDFSHWLGPPSFDADFDNIRYESFASRNQTTDDIMKALADSNVGVIGVYGWSGVGKTSLIKEVAKQVKGNMFDVVIMVNITSHPDIRSIQGQIADRFGMKLEEESESGRAAHIRERLKNWKEKTLIILDDMRVKLDFNMVGIPLENNDNNQMNHKKKNPSTHPNYLIKTEGFDTSSLMNVEEPLARYKGCKILMISDSEQLLLSQMNGKDIQTFRVGALTEEEAEMMFMTMAELGDEQFTFKKLAAKIAKKCKGLPMTIVTTANALKTKSLSVWEDMYRQLERQNLTATMPEFSTKLSYELIENEELKHTFLVCASMGHDALITDLVRYCIGLGFLQGIHTVREARDRVHVLIGKLKELSLLADSFSSDRFTMQDITRAAALSIASQQMHSFALTKQKLDEWPDKDKLRRYTVISLQHCDITHIMKKFPRSINCSRLKVFHFDNKDPHLEIPHNFFNGMKELRVLILIGVRQSSLPSSIKCLQNLRMLCLEGCKLGGDLSIIGDLETLRVLSLSGSDVNYLPIQLRQLTKLQIFDISNCFKLEEIPAEMFSSLTSLEELYAGNSPIQWKDEGEGNQSGKASLSELRQLDQLTTLVIQIQKITVLPNNLFFDKLDRYKIIIREYLNAYSVWDFKMLEMSEASRYLALQLENGFHIHQQKEIKILFGRVENLLLGQLKDVEDIFYELNYEGFPYLKYLSIVSNSKVKSIINSKNKKHPEKAYPKLESLFLYEVQMEHICRGQLTNDSFCKLKIIKLEICGQLKNVFFSSMIKHFSALETIEVSKCNSLKEIVTLEGDSNRDEIKFPELRSLALQSLSEFIGFYIMDGASIGEQVQNRKPNELFDKKVCSKLSY
uniref:Disease resistance protein At4g27220 n=1 Tax=Cajanus cajan TaxID=3821 RepID=A0A151UCD0_CAJCA|nr:putative disease resistance protein At4g27220 [Cajanus cajan]